MVLNEKKLINKYFILKIIILKKFHNFIDFELRKEILILVMGIDFEI